MRSQATCECGGDIVGTMNTVRLSLQIFRAGANELRHSAKASTIGALGFNKFDKREEHHERIDRRLLMGGEPLLYDARDGIVVLTLNRPEQRNAISDPDIIAALEQACWRMGTDTSVRAAILTGAGTVFSSGGNVKAMAEPGGRLDASPAANRQWYLDNIQRIPRAFAALEVPIIAAVNGAAIGAGCDLACMCDIRIATPDAMFAESFVKMGLVPGDGGAWLLPRIIGSAKASELALTGEMFRAAEALTLGLISRIVEPEELLPTAHEIAAKIAANPPIAVRMTKRLLRAAETGTLESVLQLSASMQAIAHATNDHKEAVMAFIEKRTPRFSGS